MNISLTLKDFGSISISHKAPTQPSHGFMMVKNTDLSLLTLPQSESIIFVSRLQEEQSKEQPKELLYRPHLELDNQDLEINKVKSRLSWRPLVDLQTPMIRL